MDTAEAETVELFTKDLIECLTPFCPIFIPDLVIANVISCAERELIEQKLTSRDKLNELFKCLRYKDNGFAGIIDFLMKNNMTLLADKLLRTAGKTATSATEHAQVQLETFKSQLAQLYRLPCCSNVDTLFDQYQSVDQVWVPQQLSYHLGGEEKYLTIADLLENLSSCDQSYMALIKGDPGMGKSVLSKKIAYDWAMQYTTSQCATQPYSIVLSVTLRSITFQPELGTNLLELAVGYLLEQLKLAKFVLTNNQADLKIIINTITQLGPKALVLFDGLDEYVHFLNSPFKDMFDSKSTPEINRFKMIVTSRPYACRVINRKCYALEYNICPIERKDLEVFVKKYCKSPKVITNVVDYIRHRDDLVIGVPLILTFVCYLAENDCDIPSKLTRLYESLVREMLWREVELGRITTISNDRKEFCKKWRNSAIVKTTAKLAFLGCVDGKFEFDEKDSKKCNIAKDSYICGYLLQKYVRTDISVKCEFPHRSIQEFLASLHCFKLLSSKSTTNLRNSVLNVIFSHRSQSGRFFFGLCSNGRFSRLQEWLNLNFDDITNVSIAPDITGFLTHIAASLSDCTKKEQQQFGEHLAKSIGMLSDKIKTTRNEVCFREYLERHDSYISFYKGMKLVELKVDDETICDWFIRDAKNSSLAKLVALEYGTTAALSLPPIINKVEILTWRYPLRLEKLAEAIDQFKHWTSAKTLFIANTMRSDIEFVFNISYKVATPGCTMETFRIELVRQPIRTAQTILDHFNTKCFSVASKIATHEGSHHVEWFNVTVTKSVSQAYLIGSLIRHALFIVEQPTMEDHY